MKVILNYYDLDKGGSDEECLLKRETLEGSIDEIESQLEDLNKTWSIDRPCVLKEGSFITLS